MNNKIMALHPGKTKKGVNISRAKYEMAKAAILDTLKAQGEMTFDGLLRAASEKIEGKLDGSPSWYVTTVKLDLEARGVIERVGTSSPQRVRLKT